MKKVVFAIFALAISAACASAQVIPYAPATAAPQTIVVNATIQPSASLTLSGGFLNFDVVNPAVITPGNPITVTGTVSMHKGGSASFAMDCTDLTGKEAGNVIPSTSILLTTTHGATDTPLVNFANYWFTAIATSGSIGEKIVEPLGFKLAPVPNFKPDQYTGVITVTLQVV